MDEFTFSYDFAGTDRRRLLRQAANTVQGLQEHLGKPGEPAAESPEARLMRQLEGDVAEFSAYPVVHEITGDDFTRHQIDAPIQLTKLAREFRFFFLHFPITLIPKLNWPFRRLECIVEFSPGETEPRLRPKAYQIFPDKKFKQLFAANDHLEVKIGERFEFEAAAAGGAVVPEVLKGKVDGEVTAAAAAELGFVIGPFSYSIKRAQIDHSQTGLEKVFWRIEGREFFQDQDCSLIVIAQVPRETKSVTIAAALQASRDFSLASASLSEAVKQLPARLKTLFTGGIPLEHTQSWDLSKELN